MNAVFRQHIDCFDGAVKERSSAGKRTQTVGFFVAVKAQTDKKIVVPEKFRPFFGEERAVRLQPVKNGCARKIFFVHGSHEALEKIKARKRRFAALKGKKYAAALEKSNAFAIRFSAVSRLIRPKSDCSRRLASSL